MSWFSYSIFSILFLAGAELIQQHILTEKHGVSGRASAVLTFLVQSLLALPLIFILGIGDEWFSALFNSKVILQMLGVSILGSIGMVFYLNSFKVKDISVSVVFISLSAVISTVLGILLFGETVYLLKFVGIALVLLAIVALHNKHLHIEKNHYFGLLAGIIFGVTYTMDKYIVQEISPLIYISITFPAVALFGFLGKPKVIISTIKQANPDVYKFIILSGILYVLYNLATFTAYKIGGEVGRIDAINNSQVFLIILFEYFVLKQTSGFAIKLTTAVIAFVGVLILGLY